MIVLATDFGLDGPYVGQVQAVLAREAPGVPTINLFADLPRFDPRRAAYLLAAFVSEFPVATVFLGVVDPGVGTERGAIAIQADGRWYVGPDNGLFNVVAMRAQRLAWWDISWRPERLSSSFHGRDLFAPVAARLARGEMPPGPPSPRPQTRILPGWTEALAEVVFIDHYGNAMTGLRARGIANDSKLDLNGQIVCSARTFADVPLGQPFWYANSVGLVEIAANQERADHLLGLHAGTSLRVMV